MKESGGMMQRFALFTHKGKQDIQTMDEEDFLWAKKITDEYRAVRKYMAKEFYNHASDKFHFKLPLSGLY